MYPAIMHFRCFDLQFTHGLAVLRVVEGLAGVAEASADGDGGGGEAFEGCITFATSLKGEVDGLREVFVECVRPARRSARCRLCPIAWADTAFAPQSELTAGRWSEPCLPTERFS